MSDTYNVQMDRNQLLQYVMLISVKIKQLKQDRAECERHPEFYLCSIHNFTKKITYWELEKEYLMGLIK